MSENAYYKFREKFIEEANSLLDKLEKDLLDLEKNPEEKELLESVFRAMHTIKGISGMYGFDFISEFTHVLENIYQSLREKKIKFNRDVSEISFESIDHIRKLLEDEKLDDPKNKERHSVLMKMINEFASLSKELSQTENAEENSKPFEKTKQTFYIILNSCEKMFFRGINLIHIFDELATLGEYRIQRIPVLNTANTEAWGIALVTEASIDDVREVFLFIEDDCNIFRITKNNLFELEHPLPEENIEKNTNKKEEPSIMDLIESNNIQENQNLSAATTENNESAKQITPKHQIKRISVDSTKLDYLMYLVSELITVNSQLITATKQKNYEKLQNHLESIDSLSKKFRNNALEIRLVPLSDIVLRFQRLIRDLSNHLGKQINFVTEGIETELDKNTIDLISEPLMHIIRNCIDHGIETPEKRKAKGKAEAGIIKISASQTGNDIIIKVSDDGNGIDLEKVRLKAVEKGLLDIDDKPGKNELFDLIFIPGFSTVQSLSEVSGRGVGMDVVKKKIIELRGEIIVESEPGQGTAFILKIPQSLAITDTLLFKIEKNYFIIPLSEIDVCDMVETELLENFKHTSTIPYGEELIPLIDLRDLLKINGKWSSKIKSIIIRNSNKTMALLCETIIGEHQAVLKPLGKSFNDNIYITSASQLGDGNIAFMLDTALISKNLGHLS